MSPPPVFNRTQQRILWYLKRHGPLTRTTAGPKRQSIVTELSSALNISITTISANLRRLEDMCVVLRTYAKGKPQNLAEGRGNALVKLELVDPGMSLPPEPQPLPIIVVDAIENEELYQMTTQVPSSEETIIALLERNEELQSQIEKLQEVIVQLSEQKEQARRTIPDHLTQRIRSALTPEQWDTLSHSAKR